MTDDIQGCRLLPYISHWQSHQSVPPATQSALNRHPASRRSAFRSTLWPLLPPAAASRAVQGDSATAAWALRVGVAVSSRPPGRAESAGKGSGGRLGWDMVVAERLGTGCG